MSLRAEAKTAVSDGAVRRSGLVEQTVEKESARRKPFKSGFCRHTNRLVPPEHSRRYTGKAGPSGPAFFVGKTAFPALSLVIQGLS
jgi:hypothetical protein